VGVRAEPGLEGAFVAWSCHCSSPHPAQESATFEEIEILSHGDRGNTESCGQFGDGHAAGRVELGENDLFSNEVVATHQALQSATVTIF
jgi:hypothetical protein